MYHSRRLTADHSPFELGKTIVIHRVIHNYRPIVHNYRLFIHINNYFIPNSFTIHTELYTYKNTKALQHQAAGPIINGKRMKYVVVLNVHPQIMPTSSYAGTYRRDIGAVVISSISFLIESA